VRRTVVLAALVVVGAALLLLVRAPVRPTGLPALGGHRVVRVPADAVVRVELAHAGETLRARRTAAGWEIDGRPAEPGVTEALVDLVAMLTGLRAIDVFRGRDATTYGLDRPRSQIVVATVRRTVELDLGELNSAGSAVYARRTGDPRVLLVGTTVASAVDRVLYQRRIARGGPP
jgi:hypothetical protein